MSSVATPGSVSLVGAGPGDPDLLTVQAIKAIRRATVLLVDDLVGAGVLRYARRSTRIVHVGKRGGCKSTPLDAAASSMQSPAILIVGNVLMACKDRGRSSTEAAPGGEWPVQCFRAPPEMPLRVRPPEGVKKPWDGPAVFS